MTESVDDFLGKLVEVSGTKGGYEYIKPNNREFLRSFCDTLPRLMGHT